MSFQRARCNDFTVDHPLVSFVDVMKSPFLHADMSSIKSDHIHRGAYKLACRSEYEDQLCPE